jgi:hypothetical protein
VILQARTGRAQLDWALDGFNDSSLGYRSTFVDGGRRVQLRTTLHRYQWFVAQSRYAAPIRAGDEQQAELH